MILKITIIKGEQSTIGRKKGKKHLGGDISCPLSCPWMWFGDLHLPPIWTAIPFPSIALSCSRRKKNYHQFIAGDGGQWRERPRRRIIKSGRPSAIGATFATESLWVAKEERLEHLWAILEESKAPSCTSPVQLWSCTWIPPISGSVWKDQGSLTWLCLFRATWAACTLYMPS